MTIQKQVENVFIIAYHGMQGVEIILVELVDEVHKPSELSLGSWRIPYVFILKIDEGFSETCFDVLFKFLALL